jgi:hypothetical protein
MSHSFEKLINVIEFSSIERIIISRLDPTLFCVSLKKNAPNYQDYRMPRNPYFQSMHRQEILRHVFQSWNTDYLYKNLNQMKLPMF